MGPAFYRNAECCALVFDLTEPKSFETIDNWRTEFLSQLNPTDPDTYPFVLIGNKSDKTEERKVPESKIKQYCASRGNMPYYETSAKENLNVDKAFEEVASLAFKRDQKNPEM
jgi:Ras-related protein Rab-7A